MIVYTEIPIFFFKKQVYQVDGGSDLIFDFKWDPKQDPKTQGNLNVSETNLFYLLNMFHDFLYEYGFTESAGNFQMNNFDKGGKEGDPVIAMVQDPSGENNAYFMCPPDGFSGFMHMFLFSRMFNLIYSLIDLHFRFTSKKRWCIRCICSTSRIFSWCFKSVFSF